MQTFLKMFSWDNRGNKGPWGQKPRGGDGNHRSGKGGGGQHGSGGGDNQPDIEDMLRHAQHRMRGMMGDDGGGDFNGRLFSLIILVVVAIWLGSGFYRVQPDEQGVVLRFGKYLQTTEPGLNYHLPWPIENVYRPQVTRENIVEVGFRSTRQAGFGQFINRNSRSSQSNEVVDVTEESLMLTGDENILDLDFTVRWKISDARNFLFNVADPSAMIKDVAESAMREVIGHRLIDDALTENKADIQVDVKELMQKIVDGYRAGIQINGLELQQVNPPVEVIDAFRDVQAARADAEKMLEESKGYENDIIPRARGQVAQIMQGAEAYKASKVAKAVGEAQRFTSQVVEYRKAKDITIRRLYLETMETVLKDARKVVIGTEAGKNVLPYLPLDSGQRRVK